MKTSTFAFLILALVYAVQNVWAGMSYLDPCTGQYRCPGKQNPIGGGAPGPGVACDPAFITFDNVYSHLKQKVTQEGARSNGIEWGASADAEKTLIKALDEAKTPDRAWAVAVEAWKLGVSAGLQRQALVQVRSMAKLSAETETANFMLAALENPAAEMERCREWGSGTALERKKAADRLALLLQNPNLSDRLK